MKRKRYDTVELVQELKRERRAAVLLSLAGVAILLVLLGIYLSTVDEQKVPAVPGEAETLPGPPTATVGLAEPIETKVSAPRPVPEKPPESSPEPAPATLKIMLSKKAPVWVDGKSIGSVQAKSIELPEGKHEVSTKLGKKSVDQTLAVKSGSTYELRFDAKKKKWAPKKVK